MKSKKINGLEKKSKTVNKFNTISNNKPKKPLLPLKKIDMSKIYQKQKTMTPVKIKKAVNHMRSHSMTEICKEDLMDFDQWNVSEKIKKQIFKEYKHLETQVNTLKKKEKEMESKKNAMEKRASEINEIKVKKNQFKNAIKEDKELKRKQLNLQKEKMKLQRDFEHERYIAFINETNKKRQNLTDKNKDDQKLMRTMLSQTLSRKNAFNKCMYLKEKEHKEKFRKNKQDTKDKNDTQKKILNKRNYDLNLTTTESLRDKLRELERVQSEYKSLLKNEKIKVSAIEHPINYMNHTFYKGSQTPDNSTYNISTGSYIHYSPIRKRAKGITHTPEKSTGLPSKRNRICKTPIPRKKI